MIDVCLILEGTYPYVAGGVSTWVHQLVSAMTDIRFGIVYIAPNSDPTRSPKYELPPHVISLKEIYLHDYQLQKNHLRKPTPKDFAIIKNFYLELAANKDTSFSDFLSLFNGKNQCLDTATFFSHKGIWDILVELYEQTASDISFLDFFWTWRGTHLPLMNILQANLPPARIYHAVSTGYAGLLGAIAKQLTGSRFFVTEHGIYTHERLLEIAQANWIYEQQKEHFRAERDLSFFKKWWVTLFQVMSQIAYHQADRIFTLYEGNRLRQILEGAPTDKIQIVPNGIDLAGFASIKKEARKGLHIGLIGRVVSIKDIKTFLEAAALVHRQMPEAHFYVIGPADEEEDYFEECKTLAETLGLDKVLSFTGRADIRDYYKFINILVLTSVSEAQPYVILEANICGIPVVATDVGACREMLEGRGTEDRAIGPSGLITDVANPHATADALLQLAREPSLYEAMALAGQERVKRFYDQDDLLSRYLNLYEQNL